MTITIEQYKEAKALVREYEANYRKPKYIFVGVTERVKIKDAGISTRLYNSLEYYFKKSLVSDRVSLLKTLHIKRFAAMEGVGAVQVRELKELCGVAKIGLIR